MKSPAPLGRYPALRLRRPRARPWSRALHAETALAPSDLIAATILREDDAPADIAAMPGTQRLTVDEAVEAALRARDLRIPALALFPFTGAADRTPDGENALNPNNLMARAARAIKRAAPEIGLIGDVALDPYTDHGHDGVMRDDEIANDETVAILARQAVVLAEAGFDIVAPSDMMDGRVGAIRARLDEARFKHTQIMAYAAKYASAFYGPYRDAIGSAGVLQGDKRAYQMDAANRDEALREVGLDLAEGADSVMVKPGLAYLDIVAAIKNAFCAPVFAFQVSGEYAMIKAAAAQGFLDEKAAMLESLLAFKRAGAHGVFTYFAEAAARALREDRE